MRLFLCLLVVMGMTQPLAFGQSGAEASNNPFFEQWSTPFEVPPFDQIKNEHYLPAFKEGIARQRAEVDAITASTEPATFENTIAALDASGSLLDRVGGVFYNMTSAETSDEIQAIAREVSPLTTALADDIILNEKLFERVKSVWEKRQTLGLDPEQLRLVEETYKDFVRGGANLPPEKKQRLREINEKLSMLSLQFGDNVLKETNAYRLVIEKKEDLSGLPEGVVAAAAEAAAEAGLDGKWVFTLHAPSIWPFLTYADNRELRRQIFTAYIQRGNNGNEHDNGSIVSQIAALRAERANLLGYPTHAHFVLEERMAKTPEAVDDLLQRIWKPALEAAKNEAKALQEIIDREGGNFKLEPWDWWYYAEKLKKEKYDLDENEVRPYFTLNNVRDGAFYVANRLYGLTFEQRTDLPKYHPDVQTFEVKDADGSHLGVFYVDYHPRAGKRGGAWSSRYRGQFVDNGQVVRPVVVNVCNFTRPTADTPALLRPEEVETLFHEFGHAIHSLVSNIRYRSLAGVPRDYVELPSQIMEHWAFEPEVLKQYARHYKTGEVIPDELVAKIEKAGKFNQGFATVEYLAASFLDMDWHLISDTRERDADSFEKESLERIGLIPEIVVRYRSPYFQHIFSGGYSAGYYSYIWSEVLDADAFQAFKEKGIFDQETARSFRKNVLEPAGTREAMDMYRDFRGREPTVEPLLEKRGLNQK